MDLATFIASNLERILKDWEASARQQRLKSRHQRRETLRDNAGELLRAISRDLAASREARRREGPEQTRRTDATPELAAAAEEHGADRAKLGFTLDEMVSEFPPLRSSVTGLWLRERLALDADDVEDLIHFNACVDVALSESVSEFVGQVNRSRELFLAILGHDLRDPLSGITMSSELLVEVAGDAERSREIARRIGTIAKRLHRMVADLLDFTRSRFGAGIPIDRQRVNLRDVVQAAADEIQASNPERPVHVDMQGDLQGNWDPRRIGQALSNVLGNAVHHGAPETTVDVTVRADEKEISLLVHNEGAPIPPDRRAEMFDPLRATIGRADERPANRHHLGLGLYIAKEIVGSHHGRIDLDSSAERGTTFTIHLPRE